MIPIRKMPPAPPAPASQKNVVFGKLAKGKMGHRIVLYGPGGVGKTTLCSYLPDPVAFVDLDGSLPILAPRLEECGTAGNVVPVDGITDWQGLRAALQSGGWDSVKSIVIDTATKAEEFAMAWTLANRLTDKNSKAQSIEDYGWGKGYTFLFDTFMGLLADLDRHAAAGRNVALVCHDCTANVPNPTGADWIRYEPRLQSPKSGIGSVRLRVREWADHVLFLGYDVAVSKDGKGTGGGTRTIYTSELPFCMAKSRSVSGSFQPDDPTAIWNMIIR